MALIYPDVSRTFSEFLLVPNLTRKDCMPDNVNLKVPIAKFKKGSKPDLELNIPMVSAVMQSVSDNNMAVALARNGGISFIYGSQGIETQVDMVKKVKLFKAGFVISSSNLKPVQTLKDVLENHKNTGHSTMAITDNGTPFGKLMGIVTNRDYRLDVFPMDKKISEFMTPFEKLICGKEGISLREANEMIWQHKINSLPIIDDAHNLKYIVFRKDIDSHREYPNELTDNDKRLVVGAGINSRDYKERVPALVEAGVDIMCVDSSDGFTEWQKETIVWIKENYGNKVKVGAGNVVDKEGFLYLTEAGADFIKVGIGGGSICITREQKGIGRGQASAILEIAAARDEYYKNTGFYVPICSDGGITQDYHIVLALAMGADFVMLGRYFARFDEAPGKKHQIGSNYVKEYWGEGSNRARNWQRYDSGGDSKLMFEEGVDAYVPYAGPLKDNIDMTLYKIKSTMCNCGSISITELRDNARLTIVSSTSLIEGGAHDVMLKDRKVYE